MKTEVIMKRDLFGNEISQKSKSEFFSATDLMRAGNKWRMENSLQPIDLTKWLQNKSTKDFIVYLEKEYGVCKISGSGRGTHTWVHPFLFIKIALAINPEFEIKVYQWIYDDLIKWRNISGESYKKFAGSIFLNITNKSLALDTIKNFANRIKIEIGVEDWNTCGEDKLKRRDRIHDLFNIFSDIISLDLAIEKAIEKEKKEFEETK